MKYYQEMKLKDGRDCLIRNGQRGDGKGALDNFILTHRQTPYLLSTPAEINMTVDQEDDYLQQKADSEREIEMVAIVDDEIVGLAGLSMIGTQEKVSHRVEVGISIDQAYWHLGIGSAMLDACIACARDAHYHQIELSVVGENQRAIQLYQKEGFVIFGKNPHGFYSQKQGYQELVYMLKVLP